MFIIKYMNIEEVLSVENINEAYGFSIKLLKALDEFARSNKLENTQEFIDWQDNINEISVR